MMLSGAMRDERRVVGSEEAEERRGGGARGREKKGRRTGTGGEEQFIRNLETGKVILMRWGHSVLLKLMRWGHSVLPGNWHRPALMICHSSLHRAFRPSVP